jgi:hypothetical protein
MKRQIAIVLVLIAFLSCKKEKARTVTYEVVMLSNGTWSGSYLNENAQIVSVKKQPSGWKYTFEDDNQLQALTLSATPDINDFSADAIMNIYVSGKLYATATYRQDSYLNIPFN